MALARGGLGGAALAGSSRAPTMDCESKRPRGGARHLARCGREFGGWAAQPPTTAASLEPCSPLHWALQTNNPHTKVLQKASGEPRRRLQNTPPPPSLTPPPVPKAQIVEQTAFY